MTDLILALVADYGVLIVFCVTFLSCLALPVPSSLLMLVSGGFAATGDLSLAAVASAAFGGAVLGDNSGYWVARFLGTRLDDWLATRPKRAALRDRAARFMDSYGGSSVFFSCWLVAPLGPYINYLCGMTKYSWLRFAFWGFRERSSGSASMSASAMALPTTSWRLQAFWAMPAGSSRRWSWSWALAGG